MKQNLRRILTLAIAGILALSGTSCSRFSSKARHMRHADSFFAAGAYADAEIEYRNVLQADGLNPKAIARLGIIFSNEGSTVRALPFLMKSNELHGDTDDWPAIDTQVQLRLAQVSLARGDAKKAREQAVAILGKNPSDQDAPLLLAEAATKPDEIQDAIHRLKDVRVPEKDSTAILVALATLGYKSHDKAGAEQYLKKALEIDNKSSAANYGIGVFTLLDKNKAGAEQYFETAYKYAPPYSQIALRIARFKIQANDSDGARHMLEEIIQKTPDFVAASLVLAELDFGQKKYPAAESLIAKMLAHDSYNPDVLLLSGRVSLAQGKSKKAAEDLARLAAVYPKFSPAYYFLGQAYLQGGDPAKASEQLSRAVALNPNYTDAALLLAKTNISRGLYKMASDNTAELLKKHPDFVQGMLLQAQAYWGQGDYEHALQTYRSLEELRPQDPEMPLLTGRTLRQMNQKSEARKAFNRSVAISPSYLPAVEQLINLDLVEKKYDAALDQANAEIARDSRAELPRLFLAKIYLSKGDKEHAEAALLKTVELNPDAPRAYFLLAQLYATSHREAKALEDLKAVVEKDPKAVVALMMMGEIYEGQKNYQSAREAYEKILAINPKFSSAVNNLAYLYAEKLNQQDKGFEYAQRARELLPNEPHVADTLGWILYGRRQYTWALGLLEEAAGNLPSEPDVQYHAGMIHYVMGEEIQAKAAFERALQIQGDFEGRDDASKRLALLKLDPSTVAAANRPSLEATLEGQKSDLIALVRLASLYERDGAYGKAAESLQAALQANPANVRTMVDLARLYNLQHDTTRALEMAKAAHKAAPNDPDASHSLSVLAYQTHDYQWSYNLLKETIPSMAEDPQALYDFANAAFSVGKLQEAEDAMASALSKGLSAEHRAEAQRFESMVSMINTPTHAAADKSNVDNVLKKDPEYAAAIMARADLEEAAGTAAAAQEDYEKVLGRFPDFSPGKRRLAVLYSRDPSKDERTSALANSALEAFPGDPDLGRVQGIMAYRRKNFMMAASLLQDISQRDSSDAVLQFYLGMSQFELKNSPACRKALQRALELGLDAELSAQARTALAAAK